MKKLAGNQAVKTLAVFLFLLVSGLAIAATLSYQYNLGYFPYQNGWNALEIPSALLGGGLLPALFFFWLLTLALFVFLMFAAGRHHEEPYQRLNWMDRIPVDLYLVIILCLGAVVLSWMDSVLYFSYSTQAAVAALAPLLLLVLLIALGGCMSLASRFKSGAWWRNSLIFLVLRWLWRLLKKIAGLLRLIVENLPIIWKFLLGFGLYALCSALFLLGSLYSDFWALMFILLNLSMLLLVCSAALQMRKLQKGGQSLAQGDLNYHLKTEKMFADFRRHAEHLNSISTGMAAAVEERLKSERFKTELITNVSHDLKTPLTSIINYVDLLQKVQVENPQAREYIDVLARQSARLRKLTEDLIEVSKASTGNVAVNAELTNVTELINQCLGEYSERFPGGPADAGGHRAGNRPVYHRRRQAALAGAG